MSYRSSITELQIRRRGCDWMKRTTISLVFSCTALTRESVNFPSPVDMTLQL